MCVKRLEKYRKMYGAGDEISEQLHEILATWFVHRIEQFEMVYISDMGESLVAIVKTKKTGSWFSRSLKKYFG